jgi:hypothetical protein
VEAAENLPKMQMTEIETNFSKFFPKEVLQAIDEKGVIEMRLKEQKSG